MPRVPKNIAVQLIPFVKKIEVTANYWDPKATSAFEFARQMGSAKLIKFNPTLSVQLNRTTSMDPPFIHVEFTDGTSWDTETFPTKAVDLRNELYSRAEDAEDAIEDLEGGNYQFSLFSAFHAFCMDYHLFSLISIYFL